MRYHLPLATLALGLGCAACSIEVPDAAADDPAEHDAPGADPVPGRVDDELPSAPTDDANHDSGQGGEGGATAPPETDHAHQVCYPGASGDFTACFPVVQHDSRFPAAYDYPASSNAAYQPPIRFLDLSSLPGTTALAPNFTVAEVMQPHKGRYALFQPHVIDKLQSMRTETGGAIVVHSGFRSPGYNAGIPNSATFSRHMYGDGVDMHSAVVSLNSMRSLCQARGADFVKVYTSHVHCDWRYATAEPAFFAAAPLAAAPSPQEDASLLVDDGAWSVAIDGFDEGEPYVEWTAFDRAGRIVETVAAATYRPAPDAVEVEVMVGGRLTLSVEADATSAATRLPDERVRLRLETLAQPEAAIHHRR